MMKTVLYTEMFGLELIQDNEGNMELSNGLFLQESKYWEKFTEKEIISQNNCTEIYFEESDIERLVQKLKSFTKND